MFGNRDYFTGLGVFLDTYSNHNGEHDVSRGSDCGLLESAMCGRSDCGLLESMMYVRRVTGRGSQWRA